MCDLEARLLNYGLITILKANEFDHFNAKVMGKDHSHIGYYYRTQNDTIRVFVVELLTGLFVDVEWSDAIASTSKVQAIPLSSNLVNDSIIRMTICNLMFNAQHVSMNDLIGTDYMYLIDMSRTISIVNIPYEPKSFLYHAGIKALEYNLVTPPCDKKTVQHSKPYYIRSIKDLYTLDRNTLNCILLYVEAILCSTYSEYLQNIQRYISHKLNEK